MSSSYELIENQLASVLKKEIRKKLVELGRYSDDDGELSDYIMIMIANKRSKFAMQDDLSLFLGSATETFVDWLHGHLEEWKQSSSKSDGANNNSTTNTITTSNNTRSDIKLANKRKHQDDINAERDERKKVRSDQKGDSNTLELILTEEIDRDLVQGDEKSTSRKGTDDNEDHHGDQSDDRQQQDDDDEQHDLREKISAKNQERCKFWPSCKLGDKCPYHHPTKPCLMFPNCRFGDQCLYKHPMCKYDLGCMNRHCAFAHSSGTQRAALHPPPFRGPPIPKAPASKCKFGSSCLNPNCLFIHSRPEPCRFGVNCLLDTCPFTHPGDKKQAEKVTTEAKKAASTFKWTAQSNE